MCSRTAREVSRTTNAVVKCSRVSVNNFANKLTNLHEFLLEDCQPSRSLLREDCVALPLRGSRKLCRDFFANLPLLTQRYYPKNLRGESKCFACYAAVFASGTGDKTITCIIILLYMYLYMYMYHTYTRSVLPVLQHLI